MVDEWSALADFLANMIEKYASVLKIDSLPDPRVRVTVSNGKGIQRYYLGSRIVGSMLIRLDIGNKNVQNDCEHIFLPAYGIKINQRKAAWQKYGKECNRHCTYGDNRDEQRKS